MTTSYPYVVFGASGRTGTAVADSLLRAGQSVRAVVRDAAKGQLWADLGAEVAVADVTDLGSMTAALEHARGAYIVSPQHYGREDLYTLAEQIADTAARAAIATKVPKLVALSSIGADRESGTGWIAMNRMLEQRLEAVTMSVTFLRAVYFMENWTPWVAQAVDTGLLPSFLAPAQRPFPMVAAQDVGRAAAALLQQEWVGSRAVTLAGPKEFSPADVAAAIQVAAGRAVTPDILPEYAWSEALAGSGFSQAAISGFVELTHGINIGHIALDSDPKAEHLSGTTSLHEVISALVERGRGGQSNARPPRDVDGIGVS